LLLLLVLLLVMLLLRIPFFVLLICASVAADVLTAHCNSVGGKCTALSGPLSFDIYCSSCGRPFCPAACFQCTALPLLTWVARQLFQAAFASACQVCSCKAHAVPFGSSDLRTVQLLPIYSAFWVEQQLVSWCMRLYPARFSLPLELVCVVCVRTLLCSGLKTPSG
jgi:hypothetical protein